MATVATDEQKQKIHRKIQRKTLYMRYAICTCEALSEAHTKL